MTPVMTTLSPALSFMITSSVRGGRSLMGAVIAHLVQHDAWGRAQKLFAMPYAPSAFGSRHALCAMRKALQNDCLVPRRVAVDVHGDGQARDVAGKAFHMHGHGRHFAPEALGADARLVHGLEQHLLERGEFQPRIRASDRPEERLLRDERRFLEIAADTDADHHRRTGVRPRFPHALEYEVPDPLDALRRPQHADRAHVLAPRALGHERNLQLVSRHQLGIDDGRGIVAGVLSRKRIDDGLSEVAFAVSLADAFVDGVHDEAVLDPQILADLDEENRDARVLADRNALLPGDTRVFLEESDDLLRRGRFLHLERPVKGSQNVPAHIVGSVDAYLRDVVPDLVYVNFAHPALTASTDFMKAAFSPAVRSISITCSMPFSPSFTGTPAKASLTPYSPVSQAEQGRIFFLSRIIASTISSVAADGA